jgi:hypothetical protein
MFLGENGFVNMVATMLSIAMFSKNRSSASPRKFKSSAALNARAMIAGSLNSSCGLNDKSP